MLAAARSRHSEDGWCRTELQRLLFVVFFLAVCFLISQQALSPSGLVGFHGGVKSHTSSDEHTVLHPPASHTTPGHTHDHDHDHKHNYGDHARTPSPLPAAPPPPQPPAPPRRSITKPQAKISFPSSITLTPDHSVCSLSAAARLGNPGEGGWTVCGWTADKVAAVSEPYRARLSPKGPCVVLSYGIRGDSSFDDAVIATSPCNVHGFDPSLPIQNPYNHPPRKIFHRAGVGPDGEFPPGTVPFAWPGMDYLRSRNSDTWVLQAVSTLMKEDEFKQLDILKIDVEGAEWFSLIDLLDPAHPMFREGRITQYVSEWHFPPEQFVVAGAEGADVTITQTAPYQATDGQPLNPLELMMALEDAGMRLWTWRYNEGDHHCIEVSYIFVGDA